MHKLESFALSCGSKIEKPHIEKSFFPVKHKKYICVSRSLLSQSKDYDYFDDVIFHIYPYLQKNNIEIIEIGNSNKSPLFYTNNFKNLTRFQTNYILSKCKLFFGNYNFDFNIASHYNKTTICPSNLDYEETFKPYWSEESNCKILMPVSDLKPSFSDQENPKTINSVMPETIACSILDSLKINHNISKIKTTYLGEEYNNQIMDIIPGGHNLQPIKGPVNIRMDKNFDLSFLQRCHIFESINIVTDKIIDLNYLNYLKEKISLISFFIDGKTKEDDIKIFESIGKPVNLLCKNFKNISAIRLKFIDYEIRLFGHKSKKDLNFNKSKNLKFLSKRNIISDGQVYNSYLSESLKRNVSSVEPSKEFLEDMPFCRIFSESA